MLQVDLFGDLYPTRQFPKTQYLGSKQKLVNWIFNSAPKGIETVFDAFSGTSVVGYHFKDMGCKVYSNDFLKCNYMIAKCLIENQGVTLSTSDIDILLDETTLSDNLIEKNFTGVFFKKDQAQFLDKFRANVEKLNDEYKKSLALSVMCRSLTRKVTLGHFAHLKAIEYSNNAERVKRNGSLVKHLKDIFLDIIQTYNKAVFNNGKENKVYCENTINLTSKLDGIDLAYFDPPYCGCHPDYQAFYHFLETFVEYWQDKKFINGTKMYYPKKESGFVKKTEIKKSFETLFKNSEHIPHWLISYNSKSYPKKETMVELIKKFKNVQIFENEYRNNYGGKGSRKGTLEYLFYCY